MGEICCVNDGRLPSALTPFVGRDAERRALVGLLDDDRLVTVVGTGGSGKTRLATEVARARPEAACGRVWFADLSPLPRGSTIGETVRIALSAPDTHNGDAIGAAVAALGGEPGLIVVDNCEHVGDAPAVIEELLARVPELRILATSRQPLGVDGELTWRIPPLAEEPAAQLFVDRARRVRPDTDISADDENVRELVRRLDGIALAIELAAGNVNLLEVPQILAALDGRLDLLDARGRRAAARHRSIEASMNWSYELLSEPERRTLQYLAVFSGGFTLDAASAVTGTTPIEPLLGSLIDKSLVVSQPGFDGSRRYGLLETVREYAGQRLAEARETEVARDRHLAWIQHLARNAEPELSGPHQQEWLDTVEREHANIRDAFAWCEITGNVDAAVDIAANLCFFWKLRSHFSEGLGRLTAGLAGIDERSSRYARAMWALADVSSWAGDSETAYNCAEKALEAARRCDDRRTAARALWTRGNVELLFDPSAARATSALAIAMADEVGDVWLQGVARQQHAMTWSEIDQHDEAGPVLDEAIALAARHDITHLDVWNCVNLMRAAVARGEFEAAMQLYEDGTRKSEIIGDPSTRVFLIATYGEVLRLQGKRKACDELLDAAAGDLRLQMARQVVPFLLVVRAHNTVEDVERCHAAIDELRAHGSELATAWPLLAEGASTALFLQAGDATRAAASARPIIAIAREVNFVGVLVDQLRYLGYATFDDDVAAADAACVESLDIAAARRFRPRIASALDALAVVASARGQDAVAARLLGAADALRARIDAARIPPDLRFVMAARDASRMRAGDGFEDAYAEGLALSEASAVEYARRAHGRRRRPASGWASLTPMEVQVVELAAQGLTNRQIAEQLFVSAGTVKSHLAHVFTKLDVTNRSSLASLVARREVQRADSRGS
jgi:predicted ATPase/DNA-binding CsgD family transcriptional regulator